MPGFGKLTAPNRNGQAQVLGSAVFETKRKYKLYLDLTRDNQKVVPCSYNVVNRLYSCLLSKQNKRKA